MTSKFNPGFTVSSSLPRNAFHRYYYENHPPSSGPNEVLLTAIEAASKTLSLKAATISDDRFSVEVDSNNILIKPKLSAPIGSTPVDIDVTIRDGLNLEITHTFNVVIQSSDQTLTVTLQTVPLIWESVTWDPGTNELNKYKLNSGTVLAVNLNDNPCTNWKITELGITNLDPSSYFIIESEYDNVTNPNIYIVIKEKNAPDKYEIFRQKEIRIRYRMNVRVTFSTNEQIVSSLTPFDMVNNFNYEPIVELTDITHDYGVVGFPASTSTYWPILSPSRNTLVTDLTNATFVTYSTTSITNTYNKITHHHRFNVEHKASDYTRTDINNLIHYQAIIFLNYQIPNGPRISEEDGYFTIFERRGIHTAVPLITIHATFSADVELQKEYTDTAVQPITLVRATSFEDVALQKEYKAQYPLVGNECPIWWIEI